MNNDNQMKSAAANFLPLRVRDMLAGKDMIISNLLQAHNDLYVTLAEVQRVTTIQATKIKSLEEKLAGYAGAPESPETTKPTE